MRPVDEITESVIEIEDPGVMTREEKLALFGEGPWLDEPDRVEFRHQGLPCLITRHWELGNLCGYVAVPPGHPWHGKSGPPVDVHGSCNYANECAGRICHVPEPGEPADVWWFGFDCGHGFDMSPRYLTLVRDLALDSPVGKLFSSKPYRDYAYVDREVRSLAEQLVALGNQENQ